MMNDGARRGEVYGIASHLVKLSQTPVEIRSKAAYNGVAWYLGKVVLFSSFGKINGLQYLLHVLQVCVCTGDTVLENPYTHPHEDGTPLQRIFCDR